MCKERERIGIQKCTLILASKRLNIGAFLSMSGMIINLQEFVTHFDNLNKNIYIIKGQRKRVQKMKYVPDFAATNEDMFKLSYLAILKMCTTISGYIFFKEYQLKFYYDSSCLKFLIKEENIGSRKHETILIG